MSLTKPRHFIVTGWMRSGTSMMMRAIDTGGIPAHYDREREINPDMNPFGLFEMNPFDYASREVCNNYPEKVIKVLVDRVENLTPDERKYHMCLMLRDPACITQSARKGTVRVHPMSQHPAYYWSTMRRFTMRMAQANIAVTSFVYDSVVEHPRESFQLLRDNGWPIDVAAAAATVDPSLRHFRNDLKLDAKSALNS